MPAEKWSQRVQEFAKVARIYPGAEDVALSREFLDCYMLAMKLPAHVIQKFAAIPNATLDAKAGAATKKFLAGDFSLAVDDLTEMQVMIAIGGQLRAFDKLLRELRSYGPSANPEKSWLVATDDHSAFVIPRSQPRAHLANKTDEELDLRGFGSRLLQYHRVLPTEVDGYKVRLFASEIELGLDFDKLAVGASLFPEIKFDEDDLGTEFRIKGVSGQGLEEHISDNLEKAHGSKCAILVYPELTIDQKNRTRIGEMLKRRPWIKKDDNDWTVKFVLAGSWHETENSKWFNIATIFDGFGEVVLRHRKIFPYFDRKAKQLEGIESGKQVSVLVLEDALVAIGVCRDFCERGTLNVFEGLDVDLCLVTSCGSKIAMTGHLTTASEVHTKHRTRSFVVQQAFPTSNAGPYGYVISPHDVPPLDVKDVEYKKSWLLFEPKPAAKMLKNKTKLKKL